MKYYAYYDENNNLLSIGSTSNDSAVPEHELTKEQYDSLLAEIREKASFENQLYNGEITEANLPEAYAEEIIHRVADRRTEDEQRQEEEATTDDIARALEEIL